MTTDWPRVGRYVRSRRKELGLTQVDMQTDGGPSPALLRQLENGTYKASMHPSIQRGIEHRLEWHFGSITAIHEGREPSPLEVELDRAEERKLLQAVSADGDASRGVFELLARWVEARTNKLQIEQTYADQFGLQGPDEARIALEEMAAFVAERGDFAALEKGGREDGETSDEKTLQVSDEGDELMPPPELAGRVARQTGEGDSAP